MIERTQHPDRIAVSECFIEQRFDELIVSSEEMARFIEFLDHIPNYYFAVVFPFPDGEYIVGQYFINGQDVHKDTVTQSLMVLVPGSTEIDIKDCLGNINKEMPVWFIGTNHESRED